MRKGSVSSFGTTRTGEPRRVVLGRPAFFVDDDPEADMRA
jgi:hypothetical chaperone protein